MKYLKIFVVAGIGLSLILNARLLTKLDNLENRMNALNNYQSQVMSSVNSQAGNVRNVLEEMKREQSWISPIKLDIDSSQLAQGIANLEYSWQIKELASNSKVLFNYKLPDEENFQVIEAKEMNNGYFQAPIPWKVEVAPQWEVHIEDSNSERPVAEEATKRIMEQEMAENYQNRAVSYYVSVEAAGMTKSSEIEISPNHSLSTLLYSPIDVNVHINDQNERRLNVAITEIMPNRPAKIKEVVLKRYKGSQLISAEKLNNDGRAYFNKSINQQETFNRLVAKITYQNGETFEKEIYKQI